MKDSTHTSLPLVTIAIPTYNRAEKTLPATLRSAIAQTYANLEIIVSDNCSTDTTASVVRSIGGARVVYVRQSENLGLNGNLNQCLERARGAYVLLLHDDDLVDPDFVESCMQAVGGNTSVGLIRTGIRIIRADGSVIFERPNRATASASMADLMFAWFRNDTMQYCCNTLYNTQALREIGGLHSRHNLFQDALAQVKVAAMYGHAHVAGVKASWRRHDGNAGSAASASLDNWCDDSLELIEAVCELEPRRARRTARGGHEVSVRDELRAGRTSHFTRCADVGIPACCPSLRICDVAVSAPLSLRVQAVVALGEAKARPTGIEFRRMILGVP